MSEQSMKKSKGLKDRFNDGEIILVAEGYVCELESRGYLSAYGFIPEVVLEHPEVVRQLHEEFVHAGSDVVLACTYYAHREKMRNLGREDDLKKINMEALRIARSVADDTGTLMAGNICNTNKLKKEDPATRDYVKSVFKEQIEWAVEGGADLIVGETYTSYAEAAVALECIKEVAPDLPAVITMSIAVGGLCDGVSVGEACRRLEEAGATAVGLNCSRGPATMMPLLKEVRAACKGPIAAVPLPYRTNEEYPTWLTLKSEGKPSWPLELDGWLCRRDEIRSFTEEARALGVQYMGLCCGNRAKYFREMALAAGKEPEAKRYAPNMDLHFSKFNKEAAMAKEFTRYKIIS